MNSVLRRVLTITMHYSINLMNGMLIWTLDLRAVVRHSRYTYSQGRPRILALQHYSNIYQDQPAQIRSK